MDIKALLTETTIEKTKNFVKGEFSSVEWTEDDEGIVTLKISITNISQEYGKEIIEKLKEDLK